MMRKKAVHNLDTRQITMVENAYYYCNPPDRVAYVKVRVSYVFTTFEQIFLES